MTDALEDVTIRSAADMAAFFDAWAPLLRRQVVNQLGEGNPDVDLVLEELRSRWTAREDPHVDDALRRAMVALRKACYRLIRQREAEAEEARRRARSPHDRVLGEITGAKAEAVLRLPPSEREPLLLIAREGVTIVEAARRLGVTVRTLRARLHRARMTVIEQTRGLPLVLGGWWSGRRRGGHLDQVTDATQLAFQHTGEWVAAVLASLGMMTTGNAPGPAVAAPFPSPDGVVAQINPAFAAARATVPPALRPSAVPTTPRAISGVPGRPTSGAPGATAETPEDTQFVAAASAPSSGTPAIVGLGYGKACACSVLFRSLDGGATWQASEAPAGVDQVVLPPQYPRDPRIFLGTQASGLVDYELAAFGAEPTPLPVAPGQIALSSGFDTGDPRLFVAARDALWSVGAVTRLPRVEIAYPGTADVARVTTAASETDGVAVVVPMSAASAVTPPGVYLCSHTCLLRSAEPSTSWGDIAAAPVGDGDGTLAGLRGGTVTVSRDGGASWTSLPTPGHADSVAVGAGRIWLLVGPAGEAAQRLMWMDEAGGEWGSVGSGDLARTRSVLPIGGRVVLALLADGGLRCSADAGQSWSPRCPSP